VNKTLAGLVAALLLPAALAQTPSASSAASDFSATPKTKRFIACPVYRDTTDGRKSGCWLATEGESGIRFDLHHALTKPQLGREVLVEGEVAVEVAGGDADACGGAVLQPARVSVLATACAPVIIPAEEHKGRRFVLSGSVMTPNHLPQPQPAPPYVTRSFTINFDFADDYLLYQHAEVRIQEAVRLAQLGKARLLRVTGYAATAPTRVSGRSISEDASLARARAGMVTLALTRLGVPAAQIEQHVKTDPAPDAAAPAALREASKRRVTIDVVMDEPMTAPRVAAESFPLAPPPPYVPPETPQGSGALAAVMLTEPGLSTHVVYRPRNLATVPALDLPVVAFANGGCANVGNRFRYFLSEIASHGFIAIATGVLGPPEVERSSSSSTFKPPPAPGTPAALSSSGKGASTMSSQLQDAITWAATENTRIGSPYFGKINTAQVAVMGQSCGGLQAIEAALNDPRVKTLGVWNSGVLDNLQLMQDIAAARLDKAALQRLRVPALYVTGEASDVAYANAEDDVARINHVPVFRAWRERTGHSGTYREPNGGAFGRVAVAWLSWQLKGDPQAAKMFIGSSCGLCTQAEWHVNKKNIDGPPNPVAQQR
jgi:dienelactone hydrolase/outer membrane protein OmpA-like peptidoglycan-associated protein